MAECYEARREDDGPNEHDRQNAKNTTRVAAKAAGAYLGGEAGAKAVDLVSKTKFGDKVLDVASAPIKHNKIARNVNNKLNDSGAMKMAEGALDASSGSMGGGSGTPGGGTGGPSGGMGGTGAGTGAGLPNQTPNQVKTGANSLGGEQESSLPSSGVDKAKNIPGGGGESEPAPKSSSKPSNDSIDSSSQEEKKSSSLLNNAFLTGYVKMVVFSAAPFLIFIILILIVVLAATDVFSDYEDAIGISSTTGEETGGIEFNASSPEQEAFFKRIVDVKNSYQSNGKTVDALKIVAVYHILNSNGAGLSYEDMTDSKIREIADAMFSGNSYSDETFKTNLINNIIPKYLPNTTNGERETIADEIFEYVENYYDLIGKDNSNCSSGSGGNCTYDIKGFYISGSGNIAKNIKVSDLKVRLMECGSPYGNGSYTKAIDQDLVNFEDYVAGVAYAEVGNSSNENYVKAQLVAARSFALARPTAMGNAAGKKLEEENGQWILQISSCVADQVFCNIDEGCSYMGGGDGQGGIVRSGIVSGASRTREKLADDAPLRKYANETEGEVLINGQGNIVYATFVASVQNKWESMANSGLNYKQILLQYYNQGSSNFGVTDIQKASCGSGSGGVCTNTATGDWANWKQYEGSWINTPMGTSGKNIRQIGCLVTSISIQIARSGVKTNISGEFNPGSFVEYLNTHNGFASGGNFIWASATDAAPDFKYQDAIYVSGWSKDQKLAKLKELTSQKGVYVVAEVKGNTGQHWVAIDTVQGDTVKMFDPGSSNTDLWAEYNWANTSEFVYYKVG